jgi:hypothetical protein
VSLRSTPPSTCRHTAPHAVDEDEDEWWERERAAPEQGRTYLNMMMPPMKVAQRAAPEQMVKEMRWASLAEMR